MRFPLQLLKLPFNFRERAHRLGLKKIACKWDCVAGLLFHAADPSVRRMRQHLSLEPAGDILVQRDSLMVAQFGVSQGPAFYVAINLSLVILFRESFSR